MDTRGTATVSDDMLRANIKALDEITAMGMPGGPLQNPEAFEKDE